MALEGLDVAENIRRVRAARHEAEAARAIEPFDHGRVPIAYGFTRYPGRTDGIRVVHAEDANCLRALLSLQGSSAKMQCCNRRGTFWCQFEFELFERPAAIPIGSSVLL